MKSSNQYSSLLLDSGGGWGGDQGASPSYIAFTEPQGSFSSIGEKVTINFQGDTRIIDASPLQILDDYLALGYVAVGYIGYEFSRYTNEGFTPACGKEGDIYPDVNFLLYKTDSVIAGDYSQIDVDLQLPDIKEKIPSCGTAGAPCRICANMTKYQYMEIVKQAKRYIEQGDIYQINLSQRMITQFNMPSLAYFRQFYEVQPVPFACYLDFGKFQLLSGSMELFLRKKGNKITSKPIKGTIKRGRTDEIDTILKAKLISSEKERAENLMIVDLMRNDLGRISKAGSVKVNKLFEVETYSTLHQMVSEVEGEIHDNMRIPEIIMNVFPPGSVTGAPKKRALEVIDELEPHLRGPYCGTIGVFYPNGDFTLSVAIRIMLSKLGKAAFFVGGGIVWDSDPKKEYDETILKSKAITRTMGV